jgi:hypothetical protein
MSLHGYSQLFQLLLTVQYLSVLGVPSLAANPLDRMKTRWVFIFISTHPW